MITPSLLQPGDKIGIVATGRKVSSQDVAAAVEIFKSWGYQPIKAANLHSTSHNYLAGTDEQRMADFQAMINDPDIKAIACARGGYGTTRIIDALDFSNLKSNPKWVVGFSDVTAIHLRMLKEGIKSIHGTMPLLFGNPASKPSVESLRLSLTGTPDKIVAPPNIHNQKGKVTGAVVGGNLSLIADSMGTSTEPDMTGKILVIEEIDEYVYKVDRMLTQLKRAGKLDHLAGLVVGYMTDIKELEVAFNETIEHVVLNKIKNPGLPVAFNFPIGHENTNYAWIHGSQMTLEVQGDGAILSPADNVV